MSNQSFGFIDATVTSTAETITGARDGMRAVIHNIIITPDSALTWVADGAGGTKLFQCATACELNDMHIMGSGNTLLEVDAASGTTGYIKCDGAYEPGASVGHIQSASVSEATADEDIQYATLYAGVAGQQVIVHRIVVEGTIALQSASVGYASAADGSDFVALDTVAGDAITDSKMAYPCPAGYFILLKNDASGVAAGARTAYGYFHGEVIRT